MRESLFNKIKKAETKWLEKSTTFIQLHFKDFFIPSHDASHHLRSWKHAKSILYEIGEWTDDIDEDLIEAILLTTMFHDSGMTVTREAEHGSESKEIFKDFLSRYKSEKIPLKEEIFHAIEIHDQKEQYLYSAFTAGLQPDILTVSSIADDLDALGTIGVYRYAEIYLHRGLPLKSLGIKVLSNVSMRFNNLIKASFLLSGFVKNAKTNYSSIISFYDSYNQQILMETELDTTFSGHLGVINYINQFSVNGKIRPEDFSDSLANFSVGKFVSDYFKNLKTEINETRF